MKNLQLQVLYFIIGLFLFSCSKEFGPIEPQQKTASIDSSDINLKSGDYPSLWAKIEWMKFDHQSGNNSDAITIKKNHTTYAVVPEYSYFYPAVKNPFLYLAGQSGIKIQIKIAHNQYDHYNTGYFDIVGTPTAGSGLHSVTGRINSVKQCTYATGYLTINGETPNELGKYSQQWNWSIKAYFPGRPVSSHNMGSTSHSFFVVLSQPISPMHQPWIEVLNYVSEFANGVSSANDAVEAITIGAFDGLHCGNHEGCTKQYLSKANYSNGSNYKLTDWLISGVGNCFDMAATIQLFSNATGIDVKVRKIEGTFITKPIQTFGRSQFFAYNFGRHHVAWYNDKVYDACVKLKNSSGIERIAVGEDINGSYKQDLFHSGNYSPDSVFRYTSVN